MLLTLTARDPAVSHAAAPFARQDGSIGATVRTIPAVMTHAPLTHCKRSRWRLASPEALSNSLLSISHILIRHRESLPDNVPLSILDWKTDFPLAERSREQAVALASRLFNELHSEPAQFSTLVRQYSDDPITKASDGRIGVLPASEFLMWPNILDCLAGLHEGQFSEPVETPFGVHIFRIDAPPPRQLFSAKRIVIGYTGAGFLKYVRRPGWEPTTRSREQAFALARELAERSNHEDFDSLVLRYSEHRSAGRGGDIGVWSSLEPTIFPRLIDAILATPIGRVSEPMDSELGVQLFLRTQPAERERFAIRAERFAFDQDAEPRSRGSREEARRIAEHRLARWRAAVHQSNAELAAGALEGAGSVEAWTLGRGPDGVEDAVKEIRIGELLPEPVVSDSTYLIALRVSPPTSNDKIALMGLPTPDEPDVPSFIAASSFSAIASVLGAAESTCGTEAASCHELHKNFLRGISAPRSQLERLNAWRILQVDIAGELGEARDSAYRRTLSAAIEHAALGDADSPGMAHDAR